MVYILLAPGFEEAEALVPADLLRRAGIETALVSLEGDRPPSAPPPPCWPAGDSWRGSRRSASPGWRTR